MQFLIQCPQCGCYSSSAHSCPETANQDPLVAEHAVEYQRRMQRHRRNNARVMGMIIAWAIFTSILEIRALTIDRYWFPVETILSITSTTLGQILLGYGLDIIVVITWLLLSLGVSRCRGWWPTEVHCPRCESQLDEMGMKLTHCPGCQLWLG